jgi:glycosyltransferase involved in cell wall biosynthesis
LRHQTQSLVTHADSIVTISHASKNDIVKEYGLPESKITVSYPGVDDSFSTKGYVHHTKTPYFLYVGSLNKAKDLSRAIRAFGLFLKKLKKPYHFYLIGGDYWPDARIDATIQSLRLQESVKKLGIIPDDQLPDYYRGATAFFTTPYCEGFCLPAAEAMSCGAPVVTVSRGALPEIVGNGGVISKSINEIDIADSLYKIATDTSLRNTVKKNAVIKAKQYNWTTFAKNVYKVIANYEDYIL